MAVFRSSIVDEFAELFCDRDLSEQERAALLDTLDRLYDYYPERAGRDARRRGILTAYEVLCDERPVSCVYGTAAYAMRKEPIELVRRHAADLLGVILLQDVLVHSEDPHIRSLHTRPTFQWGTKARWAR